MWIIVDMDRGWLGHYFNTKEDAKAFLLQYVDYDPEALQYYEIKETTSDPEWVTVRRNND